MDKELFMKELHPFCRKNQKVDVDGKCHKIDCVLCTDMHIKLSVKKYGCIIYKEANEQQAKIADTN